LADKGLAIERGRLVSATSKNGLRLPWSIVANHKRVGRLN
jgi:hypothetical protein